MATIERPRVDYLMIAMVMLYIVATFFEMLWRE